MVDERRSPSAGWRTVYHEMATDPNVEEATHPCPDCGRHCENVLHDVYECADHGVFRASASDGDSSAEPTADAARDESDAGGERADPDADDADLAHRAPGRAD